MTRRWQPPHPRRDPPAQQPCPTGLPRFRTRWLALASIPSGIPINRTTSDCPHCGGVHLTEGAP